MDRFIERHGPLVLGTISLALLLYFYSAVITRFTQYGWSSEGLYSAVFNWSAIQTGFVFGVYGFVAGKKDGFLYELRDTPFLKEFIGYTKRATSVGFALSILSLPLIVANPAIRAETGVTYFVVAIWFSVFVWAFASFLRVALIFGRLISVKDKTLLSA